MMSKHTPMTRAVRTARAVFGAFAATLLAAVSHGLAGGEMTPVAVVATTVLAMPLCLLLAGKVGSLWRLTLAVVPAQFAYHWSFAGLGLVQTRTTDGAAAAVSPHAHHLGAMNFMPELVSAGSADLVMLAAHALAAIVTIALMHWGEHAAMRLLQLLRRTAPVHLPVAVQLPQRRAILVNFFTAAPRVRQIFLSAISHRGPPAAPAFAI